MKKVVKRIWSVLEVVIMIYVVFMTILFLNKNKYGFTEIGSRVLVSVDKDIEASIESAKKNDLLILKKNSNKKDYNDNVYYYSVYKEKYIVKYGNLKDESFSGVNIINDGRVIGTKSKRIPLLGAYLEIIHSKAGFLLLVFLPVFIVFVYQVYIFIIDSKNEQKKIIKRTVVDDEII